MVHAVTQGRLVRATLLAALVSAASSSWAALDDAKAPGDYEAARVHFESGELQLATQKLKVLLSEKPRHVSSRILLGRTYLNLGYAAAAEEQFGVAMRSGADIGLLAVPLGESLRDQRKFGELLETLKPKSFSSDVRAQVLILHGEAQLALRKLDAAKESFLSAQALAPSSAAPLTGLAHLALLEKRYADARGAAERATRIEPEHAGAWFVRGEIERTSGRLDDALGLLDEAIKRAEAHIPARNARAAILIDRRQFDAARTDVEFVRIRMPGDPQAAYLHARILFHDGHRGAAREALSAAANALARMRPEELRDHAPSALLAGIVAQAQERMEDAYQYFSDYVNRFPFNASANSRLASLALSRGELERAAKLVEPVLRAQPNNGRAHAVVGNVALRQGKVAKAREHLTLASRAFPNNAVLAMQRARAEILAGDEAAGRASLQAVMKGHPRNPRAALSLGMLYLRHGEPKRAGEVARQLLEWSPESEQAFNLLGSAQTAAGEYEAADRSFDRGIGLNPDSVSLRLNRARLARLDGRLGVARLEYEALLQRDAKSVTAMLGLAEVGRIEHNFPETIRWLERAGQTGTSAGVTAAVKLVEHFIDVKNYDEARTRLSKLEQRHYGDLRVVAINGQLELALGNRQQAADLFDRLARASGDNIRALVAASALQRRARDYQGARWSLRKAADLVPTNKDVLAALVRLEIIVREHDQARARLPQVAALPNGPALAERLRGDIELSLNRFDEAVKAYDLAAELGGNNSELVLHRYRSRRLAGDVAGGIAQLDVWLREHGDDRVVLRQRGTALLAAGRHKEAVRDFERVLKKAPRDVLVLNNLATLLGPTNPDRALLMARRARDLLPRDGAVADTLGWLLLKAGEHERALELLRDANKLAGGVPELRYHLGAALHAMGRLADARAELEGALAHKGDFAGRSDAQALLLKLRAN
jgi:cellulose synthase operon protein C